MIVKFKTTFLSEFLPSKILSEFLPSKISSNDLNCLEKKLLLYLTNKF